MSETLEGVLSEAILDELASDLGIDPDDMRKHPFFRVLKGAVLLTYPLRVQEPQFSEYIYEGSLAAGTYFVPAAGTIVMGSCLATVQDLDIFFVGTMFKDGSDQGAASKGYIGAVYHNGDAVHGIQYKNVNVGAQDLKLAGLSVTL